MGERFEQKSNMFRPENKKDQSGGAWKTGLAQSGERNRMTKLLFIGQASDIRNLWQDDTSRNREETVTLRDNTEVESRGLGN